MARCSADKLRFLNRNTNKTYTDQINKWVEEIIAMYGTRVDYYIYEYDMGRKGHDGLYGEDNPAPFSDPIHMTMYCKINADSLTLSKYGLQTQAEMEAYISISGFAEAMNDPNAAPKTGDLIRLTEAGMDRPGGGGFPYKKRKVNPDGTMECETSGIPDSCDTSANSYDELDLSTSALEEMNYDDWLRGPNIYEITEARDDDFSSGINPMMVHNVWRLKAVRFDNSYQPNAPKEQGLNMVTDSAFYGKLPGGTDPQTPKKVYSYTSDNESTKKYWDYNKTKQDEEYGGYGGIVQIGEEPPTADADYDPTKDPSSKLYYDPKDFLPIKDTENGIQRMVEAIGTVSGDSTEPPDTSTTPTPDEGHGKPVKFDLKVRKRFEP